LLRLLGDRRQALRASRPEEGFSRAAKGSAAAAPNPLEAPVMRTHLFASDDALP
jgi:hypothetical protein